MTRAETARRHDLGRHSLGIHVGAVPQNAGRLAFEPKNPVVPHGDDPFGRRHQAYDQRPGQSVEAMRRRLNELSSGGEFSTPALRHALAELDADQLSLELRLGDQD